MTTDQVPGQTPRSDTNALTLAVYEAQAEQYATLTESSGPIAHRTFLRRLARIAPPGEVLEVGSAQGRDAAYLEQHGRRVHRTDGAAAFVATTTTGRPLATPPTATTAPAESPRRARTSSATASPSRTRPGSCWSGR